MWTVSRSPAPPFPISLEMSLEESNTYVIRNCSNRNCRLEAFVPAEWQYCASCGLRFRDVDVATGSGTGTGGGKRRKVVPHPADPPAPTSQQQLDHALAKKKEIYGVSPDGSPAKAKSSSGGGSSPHKAKRTGKRTGGKSGGGGGGQGRAKEETGFLPQIMGKLQEHLSHREEIARVVREQLALARILEMKNAAKVRQHQPNLNPLRRVSWHVFIILPFTPRAKLCRRRKFIASGSTSSHRRRRAHPPRRQTPSPCFGRRCWAAPRAPRRVRRGWGRRIPAAAAAPNRSTVSGRSVR